MKDEVAVLAALEERICHLERRVFGDDINSKVQQNRQVIDEIVQINSQISRSLAGREKVSLIMKRVEDMMEFLDLEESSQLLGGEAKANAVLAAEPIIRQMYGIVKEINLAQINEAINSESLRSLTSLSGELAKLKTVQVEQQRWYEEFSQKVRVIEEAISILAMGLPDAKSA